jgi:hypothetical protein
LALNHSPARALCGQEPDQQRLSKVKAFFSGMAMAATAGLLLGGMMKPNLVQGDRPIGPQIFTGWSAARSTGPFDDGRSWAAYGGQVPDYVTGTDWNKAATYAPMDVAYDPAETPDYYQEAAADAPSYPKPTYQEPPREPPTYPSVSGGMAYAADRAGKDAVDRTTVPPPSPTPPVDIEDEAPPEATGDTTPIHS